MKTKTRRLADPGTGLWLSYSIDRRPGNSVLKRFADEAEAESEQQARPAIRDRIFSEELRSVTTEVVGHQKTAPVSEASASEAPVSEAPVSEAPTAAAPAAPSPPPAVEAPVSAPEPPSIQAPVAREPAQEKPAHAIDEPATEKLAPAIEKPIPATEQSVAEKTVTPVEEAAGEKAEATRATEVATETATPPTPHGPVAEAVEATVAPASETETGPFPDMEPATERPETPPGDQSAKEAGEGKEVVADAETDVPELIEFPDSLDDAEEIRGPGTGVAMRNPSPVIEDSQSDYNIGDEERDEIELEDPDPAELNSLERPEPVATDLSVRDASAPTPTLPPAPAPSPEVAEEIIVHEEQPDVAEEDSPRSVSVDTEAGGPVAEIKSESQPEEPADESETRSSAAAFQAHADHERQAAEVQAAEVRAARSAQSDADLPDAAAPGTQDLGVEPIARERIAENFQQADYPYPHEFVSIFERIYSARDLEVKHLDPVLAYLLKKSQADAVAWLVLDRGLGSFRPFMDMNLDVNTRKNLYFALNDKFLPEEEKYEILRFKGSLKNDFHFRKRFSTPFLLNHQGAVIINLNVLQIPSYIILFYRRLPGEEILEVLEKSSLPLVRDLLPAVQRIQANNEAGLYDENNFSERLYALTRELTDYGKSSLRIMHFTFPDLMKKSSRGLLMKKLGQVLLPIVNADERVVTLLPGRLVVLLKKSDPLAVEEAVRDACHRWGVEVRVDLRRYPERGGNLITYLEPRSRDPRA